MKVSVIIPIYNALNEVKELFESLTENFNFSLGELIIINDFSKEETTNYLREFCKNNEHFKLYENEENLGFVKTCNKGMCLAKNEIIILLNSDTIIPKEFCERIIKCFEFNSKIGVASPISSHSSQYYISLPKNMGIEDMNTLIRKKHKCNYPIIPSPEGFCFCIRKEVIEKQGYLDEIFGKGYHEENDFGFRAVQNGWKNVLIDDLYVIHERNCSFGIEQRKAQIKKNDEIFNSRWEQFLANYKKSIKFKNPVLKIEDEIFPMRRILSLYKSKNKKHLVFRIFGLKFKIKR